MPGKPPAQYHREPNIFYVHIVMCICVYIYGYSFQVCRVFMYVLQYGFGLILSIRVFGPLGTAYAWAVFLSQWESL